MALALTTLPGKPNTIRGETDEISRAEAPSVAGNEIVNLAQAREEKFHKQLERIDYVIQDKVLKDTSPAAKLGRRKMMIRAAYGEFMCTLLFYTPIFGCIMFCNQNGFIESGGGLFPLLVAFVGGFQAIAISFAFSSVSGAHFNPAISFSLWLTGKLSNRKCLLYITVQLLASIIGMAIISALFDGDLQSGYDAIAVTPMNGASLSRVFATEFFLTFFFTYVAFTVAFEEAERQKKDNMSFKTISDSKGLTLYASTPQSKTGFAPFSIGLTIFSLSLIGGASGGAFNPGRLLGPAIFSGKWDCLYLYWLGELIGASTAGLLVSNLHRFGLDMHKDDSSVKDLLKAGSLRQSVATDPVSDDGLSATNSGSINPVFITSSTHTEV